MSTALPVEEAPLREGFAPALSLAPAVLDALVQIQEQGLDPDAAMARLAALRGTQPGALLDLVWEREDYAGTVHYDAIVEVPGVGAVSLSVAPDRAVPWPLRNAVRATENQVVLVNGRAITVADAVQQLDALWGDFGLAERLVNMALCEQAVYQLGIEVNAEESAALLVQHRRAHGLLSRDATVAWLEARGMTLAELEARTRAERLEQKLREVVVGEGWRAWLEAHGAELDEVSVARLRLPDREQAEALLSRLREGSTSLLEAAEARFLEGDAGARTLFNTLRRRAMSAEQARALFDAEPGQWVGPLRSGGGFDVIKILKFKKHELKESSIAEAKQAVFEAWLAERRARATVVWSWGDPSRLHNQNAGWAA